MTTIAWDGRTLAADRCRVNGRGTKQTIAKLYDCGAYVYGGCGDLVDLVVVSRWLKRGARWRDRPCVDGDNGGLAIRKKDGELFLINGNPATLCALPPGPTAQGSGAPYAIAAMACGKTAGGAVSIAMLFDDGTGLGIDSIVVSK